ncbi:MAG TPA: EAL domain-containing protein, partial [Burkholderiaceae bacterium]|nr:EAL domain-containing protein [Burkholderiaceae bacterium]
HQLLSADGRRLVVLHRGVISEVRPDGSQRGVAILQDITAQRDAEQRIQELATRDEVTGLLNRASFLQQVDTAVQGAQWDPYQFALLALDVPRIDEVKATLGFGAGDALTMTIAARLNLCCGEGETVAHLGGSEFALLLTPSHRYRPETTLQRAQDVLAALQAPHRIGSHEVFPLCVVGIANFPDDGRSAAQLLECAQTARLGTGSNSGIAFFQPQANAQAMRELRLEAALRNAVAQGELSLQYQPQVDLSTGVITGAEALLRWTNAEFGVVPAAELIAVAERSALIGAIGAWVLREACRQAMAWRRSGLPALRVSVNLSAAQLLLDGPQGGVADSIQAALREAGADTDCLGIELPESALLTNVQRTTTLLRQIRNLGVQIAVDDFGTGMSSMSSLRSVPIDVVKVDRSFVHDVTTAPAEVSVTRAIITMAHSLHIRVLAMGVESESQAGLLAANGCDAIQGYWFSPPLPAAGFEALLREGRRLPERFTTRPQRKRTLLLVDDEENILSSLRRLFRRDGYHIVTASSAADGLQRLVEGGVDVIVSDQRMPGMTGVEFLRRAKDLYPETVRMVLSGFTELQSIIDAVNEGAIYKFLTKPWDDNLLRSHVSEAFRTKEMADENRRLAREVEAAANDLATLNERLEQSLLQQRQQAELLQASSGGLREILDELPAAVVGIDTEGMVAYINREALMVLPEACDLLGRMAAEALPEGLQLPADEPQASERQVHIAGRHFQAFRRPLRKGRVPRGALWLLVPTPSGDNP